MVESAIPCDPLTEAGGCDAPCGLGEPGTVYGGDTGVRAGRPDGPRGGVGRSTLRRAGPRLQRGAEGGEGPAHVRADEPADGAGVDPRYPRLVRLHDRPLQRVG